MSGQPVKLRIRELRARFGGMSQAELAELSGLSTVAISNLESDGIKRIELETIGKLCAAFSCSPNELFELTPLTEAEIAARQTRAIEKLIGAINYEGPFDPLDPDKLDAELADFTDKRLRSIGRVAEKSSSYQIKHGGTSEQIPPAKVKKSQPKNLRNKKSDG